MENSISINKTPRSANLSKNRRCIESRKSSEYDFVSDELEDDDYQKFVAFTKSEIQNRNESFVAIDLSKKDFSMNLSKKPLKNTEVMSRMVETDSDFNSY